jgi:hypothetical protein
MVMPATSMTMPPTTISVGSSPLNTCTPPRPAAVAPTAMSVIIAAPVHWLKNGGIRTRSSPASAVEKTARHRAIRGSATKCLNSSTDPTPTPAFPGIDTTTDNGGGQRGCSRTWWQPMKWQSCSDLDRQPVQRPYLPIVDDAWLDDSNARNRRNAESRIVGGRDRGVRDVDVHSPQPVRAGDPKCDESDVVGGHTDSQQASSYLHRQVRAPAAGVNRRSGPANHSGQVENMPATTPQSPREALSAHPVPWIPRH